MQGKFQKIKVVWTHHSSLPPQCHPTIVLISLQCAAMLTVQKTRSAFVHHVKPVLSPHQIVTCRHFPALTNTIKQKGISLTIRRQRHLNSQHSKHLINGVHEYKRKRQQCRLFHNPWGQHMTGLCIYVVTEFIGHCCGSRAPIVHLWVLRCRRLLQGTYYTSTMCIILQHYLQLYSTHKEKMMEATVSYKGMRGYNTSSSSTDLTQAEPFSNSTWPPKSGTQCWHMSVFPLKTEIVVLIASSGPNGLCLTAGMGTERHGDTVKVWK